MISINCIATDNIIPVFSWPKVINVTNVQIINPSIDICVKYGYRLLPAQPITPIGKCIKSETIIQDVDNPVMCKYVIEYEDDLTYAMLITISTMYKTFLTDEWTQILRIYNIIDSTSTINYLNTSTPTNMMYLIQLRTLDTATNKPTYSYYKSEFESFRINIERCGGDIGNLP